MITDVRDRLLRHPRVKQVARPTTRFVTVHWNGPSVKGYRTDLQLLIADANYHVNTKGWDGIAYHYAVGRDGHLYQTRDHEARLNHAGVPQGNQESLSVFVCIGEGDVPPPVQLIGLERLLEYLEIKPRYVLGHREWPRNTSCPGAQLTRWLANYRLRHSAGPVFSVKAQYTSNVRDEPSVLAHQVRKVQAGTLIKGSIVLANPVKGDSLWLKLDGTTDYIHASGLGI